MNDKISICIPAYNRVHYLRRLLDSILLQTYKNYEVIITDDSTNDEVLNILGGYEKQCSLKYYRNSPALGTPRNWMAGIERSDGEWIKIIHDDDWFTDESSLDEFVKATNKGSRFIFSGRNDFYEKNKKYVRQVITQAEFEKINDNPFLLLGPNPLGPPSTLMIHKSVTEFYDPELIWATDIEYYIRILLKERATYIDKPLINMSYNDTQVTNYAFNNPVVRIPELFHMIDRYGMKSAKNIYVYDAWWRLFRNMNIRSQQDIFKYHAKAKIPLIVKKMIEHEAIIPAAALKNGLISKSAMVLSWLLNRSNA